MKLIIASNNEHKLTEIKAILGHRFEEILSLREAGIEHETVEDGATFMENALKKAREIESVLAFSARIAAYNGGHAMDRLTEQEQGFLLNWDAEKYRRNIQ